MRAIAVLSLLLVSGCAQSAPQGNDIAPVPGTGPGTADVDPPPRPPPAPGRLLFSDVAPKNGTVIGSGTLQPGDDIQRHDLSEYAFVNVPVIITESTADHWAAKYCAERPAPAGRHEIDDLEAFKVPDRNSDPYQGDQLGPMPGLERM